MSFPKRDITSRRDNIRHCRLRITCRIEPSRWFTRVVAFSLTISDLFPLCRTRWSNLNLLLQYTRGFFWNGCRYIRGVFVNTCWSHNIRISLCFLIKITLIHTSVQIIFVWYAYTSKNWTLPRYTSEFISENICNKHSIHNAYNLIRSVIPLDTHVC